MAELQCGPWTEAEAGGFNDRSRPVDRFRAENLAGYLADKIAVIGFYRPHIPIATVTEDSVLPSPERTLRIWRLGGSGTIDIDWTPEGNVISFYQQERNQASAPMQGGWWERFKRWLAR